MLEHGGKLRQAEQRFGHHDWLDLSTGINPSAYPAPAIAADAWHRLPEDDPELAAAACRFYRAPRLLPVAGSQASIQALPRLRAPSRVTVAAPSYAEHGHHWSQHGHQTRQVPYDRLDDVIDDSDVVVLCNPNNPTGAVTDRGTLLRWADRLAARGGWLVVDEAFADIDNGNSVASDTDRPGLIVLRSVGKFFGLAGLRLGFVAARPELLAPLADMLGPWTISGPAQQIGKAALLDLAWHESTRHALHSSGLRLQHLLARHAPATYGTALFRWWPAPQPERFHEHMAQRGIWVRLFPDAARGIRFGLPANEAGWHRLEQALIEWSKNE
jgi:cobalamin biosynthetic protein CobC